MLSLSVKAGNVSHLADARYFAARGVDYIGYLLNPNLSGGVDLNMVKAIHAWVAGPIIVGEFSLNSPEEIARAAEHLTLENIQFGPFATREDLAPFLDFSLWKSHIIEPFSTTQLIQDALDEFDDLVDVHLLDFHTTGLGLEALLAGKPIDFGNLAVLCNDYNIWLAFDWSKVPISQLLQSVSPSGIELRGTSEQDTSPTLYDVYDALLDSLER